MEGLDSDRQLYYALIGLRTGRSLISGSAPNKTLSETQIHDIIQHRPKDLAALNSIPSLAELALHHTGESIVWLVNRFQLPPPAPSSMKPSSPETTTTSPKAVAFSAFLPRKRGIGGKLAVEDDDPPPASTEPLAPIDSTLTTLYEKYQKEMKSVDVIAPKAEEVPKVQGQLLDIFASGYPVQLSRLGIPSAKIVYTAIPTILSLRQGQSGASLKLDLEDLTNSSLAQTVKSLYPDVSELQIKLALCEWYHDLHPELQLNSAKYIPPKTRMKRKGPSESPSDPPPTATPANATKVKYPSSTSSSTSNSWRAHPNEFPMQPLRRSQRTPQKARILVSGAHQMNCDAEKEVDQDPTPDYHDDDDNAKERGDGWRQGTRPKKLPKRHSMDTLGFVSFSTNASKERAALTDDDFSGTEEAYFADVYSPSPKVPNTAAATSSSTARLSSASPTKPYQLLSLSAGDMEARLNELPASTGLPSTTAANATITSPSPQSSHKSKFSHFDLMDPQTALERFDQIRRASSRPLLSQ